MKKLILTLVYTSALFLSSCTPKNERLKETAQNYIDNQQYSLAMMVIEKIVDQRKLDPVYFWALAKGNDISLHQMKDFKKSLKFLDLIVTDSDQFGDIIEAQKKKAEIYFDDFQNYPQAINEYGKLSLITKDGNEKVDALLYTAKSHFYLNQLKDAQIATLSMLRMDLKTDQAFAGNQLLGNIKLALKDYISAENIFSSLLKKYPEKAIQENVFLSLALVHEENGQIDKAIDTLKQYRNNYSPTEYIDLRIKRLLNRKKNMPGARGLKK